MKKNVAFIGSILLLICALFVAVAPDRLSMAVVVAMTAFVALGFVFGMMPNLQYIIAFKQGVVQINEASKINSTNLWIPITQIKPFFGQKTLDEMFSEYLEKATEQREQGVIINDIESVINEDSLSVRSWRGVVLQVSGTLTALGLLGTFLGLVTGISGITFGTLQETVMGIETLIEGITAAFYTSIAGVILSIIFNVVYRIVWNVMLREMRLFLECFHLKVQPEAEELVKAKEYLNTERMIGYLAKLQDLGTKLVNKTDSGEAQEQRVMIELLAGVKRGEITFSLEPVCSLADRSVIKAEVKLRWNHENLGTIAPAAYIPIISSNGYIVKLDTGIWRQACEMLSSWYAAGYNPLPLIFRISKSEILSMNVAEFFDGLINEFGLAPRDIELSLDADAYSVCYDEASALEDELIRRGFKVSVYGFEGDFMSLKEIRADEMRLDLTLLSREADVAYIFDQAAARHIDLSADGIESAKQLADLKKFGCGRGQGMYLHYPLTRKEYETLMKYR